MPDFFDSDKTPWDEPAEVVVWALGMVIAAFLLHNLLRTWKEHK